MEFRTTTQRQHSQQNATGNASKRKPINNLVASVIDVMINLPVMQAVWRERRELEKLTDKQLIDIGVHPYHAQVECNRRFYDIPFERKIRATEFVRSIVNRRF